MNATLESLYFLRRRLADQHEQCACTCEHVAAGLAIALDIVGEEIANQQAWETIDQMSPEQVDDYLEEHGVVVDTEAALKRVASLITPRRYADSPWQPIATAPRDGSYIVIAGPSGYGSTPLRIEVARYVSGYIQPWRNHANDAFEDGGEAPTLWMPLPPA